MRIDFFVDIVCAVVQQVLRVQFFEFFPCYTEPINRIVTFVFKSGAWSTLFPCYFRQGIVTNIILILETIRFAYTGSSEVYSTSKYGLPFLNTRIESTMLPQPFLMLFFGPDLFQEIFV